MLCITRRIEVMVLAVVTLVLGFPGSGTAAPFITYTTQGTTGISTINFANGPTTPVLNTNHALDGILYDRSGNLIYADESLGELRRITPGLNNDTAITAFNSLAVPADLALTPNGKSVLVTEFTAGRISSVDLTTGTITPFATPGGNPQGLTFLPNGRLFAILGIRSFGPDSFLAELDPTSGAILHQSPNMTGSLDGLTYDIPTGQLYATLSFSANLAQFDPNNLAAGATLHPSGQGGDGIVSDGLGHRSSWATGPVKSLSTPFPPAQLVPPRRPSPG